jgi:hypothetical protein
MLRRLELRIGLNTGEVVVGRAPGGQLVRTAPGEFLAGDSYRRGITYWPLAERTRNGVS